jgi:PAS domain S-box-containing protein
MSTPASSYSFADYLLLKPIRQRHHTFTQLRAFITYQFTVTCIMVFLFAAAADAVLGTYWLMNVCLGSVLLFLGVLFLHQKGYYVWITSVAIITINLLIFVHDAYYGVKAGVYFFYFPLLFSIFSTLSFRKNVWFAVHLIFTLIGWVLMELTNHSLLYEPVYSDQTLHYVFIFCMVVAMTATTTFVYFIFAQIRTNAVESEREKLKAVLDSNPQMIMLINRAGQIEIFNKNFLNFYQNTYGQPLKAGADYLSYVHPYNRKVIAEGLEKAFKGEIINKDSQIYVQDINIWVNLNFVPIIDHEQQVKSVAFAVMDISERKNYERDLSETNDVLTKLNHELDNFIYRSSHDMRAPLTSVLGLVELIQGETDESERDEYIAMIGKSVHKLDSLLVNISQYAKNKKLEIKYQPIQFNTIVQEIVDGIRFAKNAQDIDFQIDIVQESGFYSDEERIRSVIGNLVSNAVRYRSTWHDSFVKIMVHVTPGAAHLEVTDNGIGIETEYQSRIFDMFFKASQKSVGSGLGLYIVKEMVSAMHGTISLQSVYAEGTTFLVDIPNQAQPKTEEQHLEQHV